MPNAPLVPAHARGIPDAAACEVAGGLADLPSPSAKGKWQATTCPGASSRGIGSCAAQRSVDYRPPGS